MGRQVGYTIAYADDPTPMTYMKASGHAVSRSFVIERMESRIYGHPLFLDEVLRRCWPVPGTLSRGSGIEAADAVDATLRPSASRANR